jgi:4-amino-4-deoxy-L-arabinose transferase-like glycosyltransferase
MNIELRAERANAATDRVRSLALLGALAFFALLVRTAWLSWHGPSEITWDGAEYARLAQNLVSGHGYVGMRGHTLFLFPPLYSLAIAALLPLTGDAERAGLAVSLLAGAGFTVAMYALGTNTYGRRVGVAAGLLAALLPFAVQLSTVVLADALFLALMTGGLALLVRVVREHRLLDAVGCGALFGCAYLTRPEGLLFAATAILCVLALGALRPRALQLALALALPFCVLAAPYAAFLSAHAGHIRLEGKSLINLDIGLRMAAGMSYTEAADAIDPQLRQVGPELADDYYFEPVGRHVPSTATVLAFGATNSVRHLSEIAHVLRARLCGTIIFALLALIGIIAPPWNRRRAMLEIVLWAYAITAFVSLGSVYHFWDRYAVSFIPLLVLWAARATSLMGRNLPTALTAILLLGVLFSTRERFTDDSSSLTEMVAGTRLLAVHAPVDARILSISDQSVYYARGTWSMLPYAPDASVALRYVAKVRPDYIVLDREYAIERPYVSAWLDHGIPDRRAVLVQTVGGTGTTTVAIYRWKH